MNKYQQKTNELIDARSEENLLAEANKIRIKILSEALTEVTNQIYSNEDWVTGTSQISQLIEDWAFKIPEWYLKDDICNIAYKDAANHFSDYSGINLIFQRVMKSVYPDIEFE